MMEDKSSLLREKEYYRDKGRQSRSGRAYYTR